MEATGYIVLQCEGIEINKPIRIEVDDLALTIEAGQVEVTSLQEQHKQLLTHLLEKMMDAAFSRRAGLLDHTGVPLPAFGMVAGLLFLIRF